MPPPPWISHPESKPLPSPSPLSASSSPLRRVDGSTPRNPPTDRSETPPSNSNTPQSASPFPTPSRGTHTRSSSHPFPLLFGSGRRRERQAAREHPKADGLPHHGRTSRSISPRKNALSANEDYVSRRCMTCDHTNTFPHGRKGFRCGKCTAMNDLEPCIEPSNAPLSNSESPFGPQFRRKVPYLSLEQTRNIIDRCLSSYLRSFLEEKKERDSVATPPISRMRGVSNETKSYGAGQCNSRTPSCSPLSTLETSRSPGSHTPISRVSSSGNLTFLGGDIQGMSLSDTDKPSGYNNHIRRSDSLTIPAGRRTRSQSSQSPRGNEIGLSASRSASIFRPLENYIMASFNGCDTINSSFSTVRTNRPRTASDGNQPSTNLPADTASDLLANAPIFQLDAKTLLLSDVVENGSWWTGNRTHGTRSSDDYARDKTFEMASGLTSTKTPRINWAELAEWYQEIIHAGESWIQMWAEMKPDGTDSPGKLALAQLWDTADVSLLDKEITESRIHAQVTLLKVTENLLQRPRRPLRRPDDIRFLLILLENPLLYSSSLCINPESAPISKTQRKPDHHIPEDRKGTLGDNKKTHHRSRSASMGTSSEVPDRRPLIIKRIIGILSNLPVDCHHMLVSWFSRFSESHFRRIVELIGSFVTYRLTRDQKRRRGNVGKHRNEDNLDDYVPTFSSAGNTTPAQLHSAINRENPPKLSPGSPQALTYSKDWQIKAAAKVMALLFSANSVTHNRRRDGPRPGGEEISRHDGQGRRHLIPISAFYNTLLDYSDLIADFEAWEGRNGQFSFCQYSFFLSIWAKIRILEHDARRQMEEKAREAFFDSILGRRGVSQYLVLKVRRECLAEDSLRSVSEVVGTGQGEIKKGLRIEFLGEEGVDAGGLRKEWFLLLVREIFDPLHGLFVYDEQSQYCYFNPYCFESSEQFFLVGVLLGLAIYNSTILDIALPPFAFRKLLACAPPNNVPALSTPQQSFKCTLDDLAEYQPALAKGLRDLLNYEGDVQETFCLDFVVQIERYGERLVIPLRPGGETRPVTNSNRREYVDLYVKYLLDTAVSRQFEPFKRGFFTICEGNALHLFRPEEIELLVRGSDEALDIPSLQAVAVYEHWHTDHPEKEPVVTWFWDFFSRVSPRDQRKILSFITGSDRIPAMGATNLSIRLVCLGQDSDRFPTARTCFNLISLYRYKSREKLEQKLWRAVVDSEGFGLK
ncbi:ubiquitin-protein ligase E3 [Histoplasma capsulatum G186AR]|uniref:HECT-type E3 ubiquitin transferase n=2 Tax=Ajellomyces capsulatus TaxID=5037 RepID=C0NCF7_AJECG|nr:ubiquitin-protein ligase E3 [Histoplasma capsulatum G186AR]EEH11348.1 ubiquitin-protein ligase E3 [Histoplasma capsulatum G186AR]KAG5302806.1 ubiquitin-protein ligase E3 [Histoplasma capsulatum]QSS71794.1 ubiquitin-protein ligase E3 [Histoplasma capsulatum G186AR]